jgi:hypothetical protein
MDSYSQVVFEILQIPILTVVNIISLLAHWVEWRLCNNHTAFKFVGSTLVLDLTHSKVTCMEK